MFETLEYKGERFTVWELDNSFKVVVNDETYELNSIADVTEFIQYYRYYA